MIRLKGRKQTRQSSFYLTQDILRQLAMNAYVSATSWMTLLVGLPAPCPDFVSTSINRGFVCLGLRPTMYCRVAMYLREWRGTTRSSWSPVSRSTAGYWTPLPSGTQMLWSGEYLARKRRGAPRSHMRTPVGDNIRASQYKNHSG